MFRLSRLWMRPGKSKAAAVDRLKQTVAQDRANVPPQVMANMKKDFARVLSGYLDYDLSDMDLRFSSVSRSEKNGKTMMVLEVPFDQFRPTQGMTE